MRALQVARVRACKMQGERATDIRARAHAPAHGRGLHTRGHDGDMVMERAGADALDVGHAAHDVFGHLPGPNLAVRRVHSSVEDLVHGRCLQRVGVDTQRVLRVIVPEPQAAQLGDEAVAWANQEAADSLRTLCVRYTYVDNIMKHEKTRTPCIIYSL